MIQKNFLLEDDNFIVYYSRNSHDSAVHILEVLSKNINKVYDFFGKRMEDKGEIYLFDTLYELKKFLDDNEIFKLEEQPEFMVACQRNKKMYLVLNSDKVFSSWSGDEYDRVISRESIYLVLEKMFGAIPEWLSAGIARYLDGSYDDSFSELFISKISKYKIPNLEDMQGLKFSTNDYDGYELSYMLVRYFIESRGKDKFLNILSNPDILARVSTKDLTSAVKHFNEKIKEEKNEDEK